MESPGHAVNAVHHLGIREWARIVSDSTFVLALGWTRYGRTNAPVVFESGVGFGGSRVARNPWARCNGGGGGATSCMRAAELERGEAEHRGECRRGRRSPRRMVSRAHAAIRTGRRASHAAIPGPSGDDRLDSRRAYSYGSWSGAAVCRTRAATETEPRARAGESVTAVARHPPPSRLKQSGVGLRRRRGRKALEAML